jgi:RNA polymerase subunit RPABC4/transcription elongation factor Spt4
MNNIFVEEWSGMIAISNTEYPVQNANYGTTKR